MLLPMEEAVLEIGLRRLREDHPDFHGFALASQLDDVAGRRLTAHGTLYKALSRLESAGLLSSRWEDVDETAEGRPRRRLYRVTDEAAGALSRSKSLRARRSPTPGWSAS